MSIPSAICIINTYGTVEIPDSYIKSSVEPDWPFPLGCTVWTKLRGTKVPVQITIDHDAKEFRYTHNEEVITGKNPTALLTQMALLGLMSISTGRMNWSHLWVSMDNGQNYVLAKYLRQQNVVKNGFELMRGKRALVPYRAIRDGR